VPTATPRESLIAVAAFLLVALLCRWVFSPTKRAVRRQEGPADYGLLVPVVKAPSAEDARMLRDHLVAEGVRAAVSAEHEVLVFQRDVERARSLVR
jgi:hypothetical protein